MPVLRDVPINLTAEEVVAIPKGRPIRPALLRDAQEAIALGATLWQPQAVYDWFDVRAVEGETAYLDAPHLPGGQATLRIGPKADLLAPARRALVGVATIGPALEQRVEEMQAAGQHLRAYMLDSAGVVALGAVGEALRDLVEGVVSDLGWGVSAALSPGSLVGWPLEGQRELCALLPLETIGVELTAYYVLVPHKSVSVVIGIGPDYPTRQVGSVCRYCALQKSCWRRREDPNEHRAGH